MDLERKAGLSFDIPDIATDIALSRDQKDRIKTLPWGLGVSGSVLALLLLVVWRMKIQPEITQEFSRKGEGSKQAVVHLRKEGAQLRFWIEENYPRTKTRALMDVGFHTLDSLLQQGWTYPQIVALVEAERKALWHV